MTAATAAFWWLRSQPGKIHGAAELEPLPQARASRRRVGSLRCRSCAGGFNGIGLVGPGIGRGTGGWVVSSGARFRHVAVTIARNGKGYSALAAGSGTVAPEVQQTSWPSDGILDPTFTGLTPERTCQS